MVEVKNQEDLMLVLQKFEDQIFALQSRVDKLESCLGHVVGSGWQVEVVDSGSVVGTSPVFETAPEAHDWKNKRFLVDSHLSHAYSYNIEEVEIREV